MASQPPSGNKAADVIEPVREEPTHTDALQERAAQFLAEHGGGDTAFTYEEEKAVLKRINLRVLPLLLGAYFFQQLDKSSLRLVYLIYLGTIILPATDRP